MKALIATLFALLLILSTCSRNKKNNSDNMEMKYEIAVNEIFQIELDANPSTGFAWKWINKQSVSVVDTSESVYYPGTPDVTGSGGKEVWKFKGLKSGTDTIKLEYCRPWDPDSTVSAINIIVKVK